MELESGDMDLIVSFPDQSEVFTLGVEAGMFWQRMQSGEREFELVVHTSNIECLRRMAAAEGLVFADVDAGIEGWSECSVSGTPLRPALKLVRGGLADT